MAISKRLEEFLEASGLPYEIRPHARSLHSAQTARRSRVSPDRLAKPVLLADEYGYLIALLPAARRIDLDRLGAQLHRELELASEAEIDGLFRDCEPGALPGLGQPWEIPTVYDESLVGLPEVYFEAGGHDDLVRMRGPDYLALLAPALHGSFSEIRPRGTFQRASRFGETLLGET
ncbi:YbaK/EbsC family protein [Myxococcota bacterium]|nr:YbaK/EbsC family protein [Myxococcota bacterium]